MSENISENKNEQDDVPVRKPFMFLGRDLTQIACFRKSFIFGISCGVAGGLLYFLATSKGSMSAHVAFGSCWLGVFGYWIPCRYKYETQQNLIMKNKYLVNVFKNQEK